MDIKSWFLKYLSGAMMASFLTAFLALSVEVRADGDVIEPEKVVQKLSIPAINKKITQYYCPSCAPSVKFKFPGHKQALDDLVSNQYVAELRRAMYWQDTVHQFQSKAHFDNCDFDDATAYIDELVKKAGVYADLAKSRSDAGELEDSEAAARQAFFALGQALHAAQDFYAHSNYVELEEKKYTAIEQIPLVETWTEAGKTALAELRQQGLVSGYVSWGVPKHCPAGTLSHGQLAKDSVKTSAGSILVPELNGQSQYSAAIYLAKHTSANLISYAFKTWPFLEKINGKDVAFDLLIDRRGF